MPARDGGQAAVDSPASPARQRVAQGLSLVSLLLLGGCVSIPVRVDPPVEERRLQAAQPIGPPVATVAAHSDGAGWTVTVRQTWRRPVEITRTTQGSYREAYLNPIAAPVGFVGCTGGLASLALASVVAPFAPADKRQRMLDLVLESCLMAVMIVRSDARPALRQTVETVDLVPESRPFQAGRVTLEWQGPRTHTISYPLTSEGRAVIRLEHLATAMSHRGWQLDRSQSLPVELQVWDGQRPLRRWNLTVSADALGVAFRQTTHTLAPAPRWPTPLIARIQVEPSDVFGRSVAVRFIRALMDRGLPVIAQEAYREVLQREIEESLEGLVEEPLVHIGPGHWLSPTVLVIVDVGREPSGVLVTVEFLNLRTREVLGTLTVPAGPSEEEVAVDLAIAQTTDLLEVAARPVVRR